jgi:hypothetical protein
LSDNYRPKTLKMARQVGGLSKIEGRVGDHSFYKGKVENNKSAHLVREKGGVSRDVIMNSPKFSRTRENMSEFALAGEMSKIVYNESAIVTASARDRQAISRLTAAFRANLDKDAVNSRGDRQIQWDDATEMKAFEFNAKRKFTTTYGGKMEVAKTPTSVTVTAYPVLPMYDIKNQAEASFAKLEFLFIRVDVAGNVTTQTHASPFIDVNSDTPTTGAAYITELDTEMEVVIVVASVKLYIETNGVKYLLSNQAYNAATILDVLV